MEGAISLSFKDNCAMTVKPLKLLKVENTAYSLYTNDTVAIISLLDAKVKIIGTVTGNLYIFERAGAVLDIDIKDKDDILNKKRGKACCGGIEGSRLFQLVE